MTPESYKRGAHTGIPRKMDEQLLNANTPPAPPAAHPVPPAPAAPAALPANSPPAAPAAPPPPGQGTFFLHDI